MTDEDRVYRLSEDYRIMADRAEAAEAERDKLLALLREGALRLQDVLTWVPNCTVKDQAKTWLASIDAVLSESSTRGEEEKEIEEPPEEERYVTHEMALDAGDPSLEGQKL